MKVICIKNNNEKQFKRIVWKSKTFERNKHRLPYFRGSYEEYLTYCLTDYCSINCTVGKIYEVIKIDKFGRYILKCDTGKTGNFSASNFIEIE